MGAHKDSTLVHVPYAWSYADAAAREAATGFAAGDVGKLARQLDDNSLWMLTDDYPAETWVQIGGAGGRTLLATATPSGTGTVSFTSISGSYKKITIEWVARSTQAATHENMVIAFNTDTTDANYRYTRVYAYGPGTTGGSGGDGRVVCEVPGSSAPNNSPSAGQMDIDLYAATTFNKVANHVNAYRRDDSAIYMLTEKGSLEWENTAAITRIDLVLAAGNFVAGSEFRLYGE
jgi:hypothetical protein